METLLGEKPYMAPLSTISSTGVETIKPISSSTLDLQDCSTISIPDDKSPNINISVSRKLACNLFNMI